MDRAAIFDVDGTLVASNNARAWAEALAESGLRDRLNEYRPPVNANAIYEDPEDRLATYRWFTFYTARWRLAVEEF